MKKYVIALISVFSFWLALPASADTLTLIEGGRTVNLDLDEIRSGANEEITLFAPFRRKEVTFRGYYLSQFLDTRFALNASHLKITAIDGYTVDFVGWDRDDWFLVTHEDGVPLSVRDHGPLRLIEVDLNGRSPTNLSLYDDWIWMINQIEVLR